MQEMCHVACKDNGNLNCCIIRNYIIGKKIKILMYVFLYNDIYLIAHPCSIICL